MNAINLNNDQKINHENTKETEQYSNAKNRILPKSSPKKIRRKSVIQNLQH